LLLRTLHQTRLGSAELGLGPERAAEPVAAVAVAVAAAAAEASAVLAVASSGYCFAWPSLVGFVGSFAVVAAKGLPGTRPTSAVAVAGGKVCEEFR